MTTPEQPPVMLETNYPSWCAEHDWWGEPHDEVRHRATAALEFPPDEHSMERTYKVSSELFVTADTRPSGLCTWTSKAADCC